RPCPGTRRNPPPPRRSRASRRPRRRPPARAGPRGRRRPSPDRRASRPAAGAHSRRAPFEAPEAAVVVVGVEELRRRVAAGDDPARAAVARAGRVDRVLAVVAARALGQPPLAVLEHAAVLAVR